MGHHTKKRRNDGTGYRPPHRSKVQHVRLWIARLRDRSSEPTKRVILNYIRRRWRELSDSETASIFNEVCE